MGSFIFCAICSIDILHFLEYKLENEWIIKRAISNILFLNMHNSSNKNVFSSFQIYIVFSSITTSNTISYQPGWLGKILLIMQDFVNRLETIYESNENASYICATLIKWSPFCWLNKVCCLLKKFWLLKYTFGIITEVFCELAFTGFLWSNCSKCRIL